MKQLLTILTLTLILVACKKDTPDTHHSYPIHVGFSDIATTQSGITNKLVVTESSTGKYLGSFEIPHGVRDFKDQLEIDGEPLIDSFDFHLIMASGIDYPYLVLSQVGVLNGSFVYFYPFESFRAFGKPISLKISGIEKFDSIGSFTEYYKPNKVVLDQIEKTLSMDIRTFSHTGNMLRLQANGASGFRYYYLPDSLHGDTLALSWDDLTPESDLTQVEIQGNPYIYTFEIEAVSPDYKNAISICHSNFTTSLPTFNLPKTLPTNWSLRVKVNTSDFFCERLFGLQEPLVITPPDLSIDKLKFLNNQIIVNTSGDVDNIRCFSIDGDFYWEINGSKASFAKVTLPDLSPFLPESVKQSSIKIFFAFIQRFEGHNAHEIQEGFPYRNTGFFPVARSGFYEIQKSF
ncbi:MAG: hypothetical protein ACKVT2_03775 [Saprospiraceae bacterium]